MALIEGRPCGATVVATSNMAVQKVDGSRFTEGLLASPRLTLALSTESAGLLRRSSVSCGPQHRIERHRGVDPLRHPGAVRRVGLEPFELGGTSIPPGSVKHCLGGGQPRPGKVGAGCQRAGPDEARANETRVLRLRSPSLPRFGPGPPRIEGCRVRAGAAVSTDGAPHDTPHRGDDHPRHRILYPRCSATASVARKGWRSPLTHTLPSTLPLVLYLYI
jgi:hypothetical protein